MIDLYDRSPTLHWYETKQNVEGQYVLVYRLGRQFAGFIDKPEYRLIDRFNLREVGIGDMRFIEEFEK